MIHQPVDIVLRQRKRIAPHRFLAHRAERLGAALLTSEKDWVKLPPPWRTRVTAWPVEARFEDEAALDALLSLTT